MILNLRGLLSEAQIKSKTNSPAPLTVVEISEVLMYMDINHLGMDAWYLSPVWGLLSPLFLHGQLKIVTNMSKMSNVVIESLRQKCGPHSPHHVPNTM